MDHLYPLRMIGAEDYVQPLTSSGMVLLVGSIEKDHAFRRMIDK